MNKEYLKPRYDKCPTCGCNIRILSDEEGTSCYESVNVQALRQILHEREQTIDSLRVEGLRKERKAFNNSELKISLACIYQALESHDEEIDAHFGQIEKMFIGLQSRLSNLVAAAESITEYFADGFALDSSDGEKIPVELPMKIWRTLSAAVGKAKERK